MNRRRLLRVEPDKNLVFRFEEEGQASATIRLWNNSDSYVAFKVKTTDPPKFRGGPSHGILSPESYRDVGVTVLGQEEALSKMRHGDKVLIMSLVDSRGSRDNTEESLQTLFRRREAMAENYELRVVYARQPRNLFWNAIFFAFSCLVFWYITMEIVSRIWTLIYGITVLVLRMMRIRAFDAAEEWVGRTLLYLGLCFLSAVREHVIDMCFTWLRVIYEAFLALGAYIFSFFSGPDERRPRYRD